MPARNVPMPIELNNLGSARCQSEVPFIQIRCAKCLVPDPEVPISEKCQVLSARLESAKHEEPEPDPEVPARNVPMKRRDSFI